MNAARFSAGGAKEYSPERSGAELRDRTPSRSNPCTGVAETAARRIRASCETLRHVPSPLSGACSFFFGVPGVPLRFTPGFTPPRPLGAPSADALR